MKKILKKLLPDFLIGWYHFGWALAGAIYYRFPTRELKVIGVTGTKGKSTTIYLAGRILEQAGYKVGWVSSLSIKVGGKEWLNPYHLTMPGRAFVQKTLRQIAVAGCRYALVEVTSEGIRQHRHRFIDFDAAVFTNLAKEHLDAHGGFENYRAAKGELFKPLKSTAQAIFNTDDPQASYFMNLTRAKKIGFSLGAAKDLAIGENGIRFKVEGVGFDLKLLGRFNAYNALAAIAIARAQGVGLEQIRQALEKLEVVEGRMEEIRQGQPFRLFVDLAHTPDSFLEVFELAKKLPHNRVIAVFGSAGGLRDKWKRPELGRIAAAYADKVILTNEDPYDEPPEKIIAEIKKGIPADKPCEVVLDRRQAVRRAVGLAQRGDIVLFLGKGTEATLVIGNNKMAWDDRRVAREELSSCSRERTVLAWRDPCEAQESRRKNCP